jgi:hypothetical protein
MVRSGLVHLEVRFHSWLESQGCVVDHKRLGTAKGDDIDARTPTGQRLLIECKGAISPRSGEPFDYNYIWKAVSGALFNTVRAVEEQADNQLSVMAFPNVKHYREFMEPLSLFCERNNIHVFWVEPSGVVEVWSSNGVIPQPERPYPPSNAD